MLANRVSHSLIQSSRWEPLITKRVEAHDARQDGVVIARSRKHRRDGRPIAFSFAILCLVLFSFSLLLNLCPTRFANQPPSHVPNIAKELQSRQFARSISFAFSHIGGIAWAHLGWTTVPVER